MYGRVPLLVVQGSFSSAMVCWEVYAKGNQVIFGFACLMAEVRQAAPDLIAEATPEALHLLMLS